MKYIILKKNQYVVRMGHCVLGSTISRVLKNDTAAKTLLSFISRKWRPRIHKGKHPNLYVSLTNRASDS